MAANLPTAAPVRPAAAALSKTTDHPLALFGGAPVTVTAASATGATPLAGAPAGGVAPGFPSGAPPAHSNRTAAAAVVTAGVGARSPAPFGGYQLATPDFVRSGSGMDDPLRAGTGLGAGVGRPAVAPFVPGAGAGAAVPPFVPGGGAGVGAPVPPFVPGAAPFGAAPTLPQTQPFAASTVLPFQPPTPSPFPGTGTSAGTAGSSSGSVPFPTFVPSPAGSSTGSGGMGVVFPQAAPAAQHSSVVFPTAPLPAGAGAGALPPQSQHPFLPSPLYGQQPASASVAPVPQYAGAGGAGATYANVPFSPTAAAGAGIGAGVGGGGGGGGGSGGGLPFVSPGAPLSPVAATASGAASFALGAPAQPLTEHDELMIELAKFFRGPIPQTRAQRFESTARANRDEPHLRALALNGCWRSVVSVAELVLSNNERAAKEKAALLKAKDVTGASALAVMPLPAVLRVSTYLIGALMRLKRYDKAQHVFVRLGDLHAPDKSWEALPTDQQPQQQPQQRGSFVPFNLFLLHAELQHCLGKTQFTIAALFQMLSQTEEELFALLKRAQTQASNGAAGAGGAALNAADSARWHTLHARWRQVLLKLVNYHVQTSDGGANSNGNTSSSGGTTTTPAASATAAASGGAAHTADYGTAIQLLQQLIARDSQLVAYAAQWKLPDAAAAPSAGAGASIVVDDPLVNSGGAGAEAAAAATRLELYSYLGRVYLQFGDVNAATATFERAAAAAGVAVSADGKATPTSAAASSSSTTITPRDVTVALNASLLCIARGEYESAFAQLGSLVKRIGAPPSQGIAIAVGSTGNNGSGSQGGLTGAGAYYSTVVNNYAIAALHNNKISVAIGALEDLLRADPMAHMTESVVSNLRTLYELSAATPPVKKKVLDGLVAMFAADDLTTDH